LIVDHGCMLFFADCPQDSVNVSNLPIANLRRQQDQTKTRNKKQKI